MNEVTIQDECRCAFLGNNLSLASSVMVGGGYLNDKTCGEILGVIDRWDDDVHLCHYRVHI